MNRIKLLVQYLKALENIRKLRDNDTAQNCGCFGHGNCTSPPSDDVVCSVCQKVSSFDGHEWITTTVRKLEKEGGARRQYTIEQTRKREAIM